MESSNENEIELNLKATQRKLNLLCSWIHLKFGQDPTFPQALLPSSSYDNDIEIKEEEQSDFEPNTTLQVPLNVEEATGEPIQHLCGICSIVFSSSQALTLHKTSHCSVKLTRVDNELLARKSARKCKLKAHQFPSDFKTWSSDEDENKTETILPDMDADYEPPTEFVASPLVKQATTSEGSTCLVRINLKPSNQDSNLSSKRTNTIKCQLCSEKFKTRSEYFRHKYNVHSKRPRKKRTGIISICPECGIKLGSIKALVEHARNEHPGSDIKVERLGKITCSICERIFYSRTKFKTHMRHIHKSEIPPELEKKITETEKEFYMFRNSWCYKCEKGFERPSNLISHLKYEHPDECPVEESAPTTTTSSKNQDIKACPYCPEKFTTQPEYFRHKFTVHADRIKKRNRTGIVSTCPVCGIKLESFKALEEHVLNEHPESNVKLQKSINTRINCSFCKKRFHSLTKFKTHLRKDHNSEVPPELKDRVDNDKEGHILRNSWCDKCEKGFERPSNLISHLKYEHPDEYFAEESPPLTSSKNQDIKACPYCPEKFTTQPEYFRHKFTVHADRIKKRNRTGIVSTCPVCGIKLASFKALEEHVLNEHPESNVKLQKSVNISITCTFCKKRFHSLTKFKTHLRKDHNNSEVPPELKDRMENDKEAHILRKSWCDKCEMGFDRSAQLITHIKTVHPDEYKAKKPENIPTTKRYNYKRYISSKESQCKECGITVKTYWLSNHMKIHGKKSFFCHLCTYSTHRLDTLKRHLETHSEERKYKCKLCPYAAKQKGGVDLHMRNIHLENEKIQCELCGQFFKAKNRLARHVNAVHHNIRPFPCNLCDKSFKLKTNLEYHLRTHSNPNGRKRGLNKEREPIVKRPPTAKRTFYTAVNMEQLPQSEITSTAEDKDIDIVGKAEPGQEEGAIAANMSSFIAHNQTQAQATTTPECGNLFSMPWYGHY